MNKKSILGRSKSHYYRCELCRQPFLSQFSLLLHFRKYHCESDDDGDDNNNYQRQSGDSDDGDDEDNRDSSDPLDGILMDVEIALLLQMQQDWKISLESVKEEPNLEKITKNLSPIAQKLSICIFCNKILPGPAKLEEHIRSHTQEKPHFCQKCDNSFSTSSNLVRHMQFHGNLNLKKKYNLDKMPFLCQTCGKRFIYMNSLNKHVAKLAHKKVQIRNKRPFICSICGKGIANPRDLKEHIKTHGNQARLPKCAICMTSFPTNHKVISHWKAAHPDYIFVQCNQCQKPFPSQRNLKRHIKTHLKWNQRTNYKCKICYKFFTRSDHYSRHMKSAHPNLPQH